MIVILILVLVFLISGLQFLESTVFHPAGSQQGIKDKTIIRDGVEYFPRQDMTVILVAGIDEDGPMVSSGSYNNPGEADMVIGSRFVDRDSENFRSTFARRVGINILSFFIKLFTGRKIYDPTSGFRACGKDLTAFFAENYPTEYPEPVSEVAALMQGYTVRERHAVMHERQGGTSSIRAWKSAYYMINVTIAMFMERIRKRQK